MIPSILTQELTHQALKIKDAMGSLEVQDSISIYTLDYPQLPRTLQITFENSFPYRIIAWEETFKTVSGWGMESKLMTTKAERIKHTRSNYWEQKYLKHEALQWKELGIKE